MRDCNHDYLSRGETCKKCGAYRTTVAEAHKSLYYAVPATMEHLSKRFAAISEQNVRELTAMIDIQFRLTHASFRNPIKLEELITRIANGESPSKLVLET